MTFVTMSAVAALVAIQDFRKSHEGRFSDAVEVLKSSVSSRASHDYELGTSLYRLCPEADFADFSAGLREVLQKLILEQQQHLLRAIASGRERLSYMLEVDELQVFEAAGAFEPIPSRDVRIWWDSLASHAWSAIEMRNLEMGRSAEARSVDFEKERLASLGCPQLPEWVALDDNSLGYDIRSWDLKDSGNFQGIAIEVKSSSSGLPKFHLSRNEADRCRMMAPWYKVHLWLGDAASPVTIDSEWLVQAMPKDSEMGRWEDCIVDASSYLRIQ